MHIVVVGTLLSVSLWAYYEFIVEYLGPSIALHLIGVPLIMGILSYILLPKTKSKWIALMILPFIVPIIPLAIDQGDPAKPGLEWILFGPIAVSMLVGEFIAWGVDILRIRSKAGGDAQA